MSGGYFDHEQFRIEEIASRIDWLVESNDTPDSYGFVRSYPSDVIEKFKQTSSILRMGAKMACRIDWLASGDDGVESFRKRWVEEKL